MYKVIHMDPNGVTDDVGEYESEEQARDMVEKSFRPFCSLAEQVEHCVAAFHLHKSDSIGYLMAKLRELEDKRLPEIDEHCEDFNDNAKDGLIILGPDDFQVDYVPELSYDEERGFYYEVLDFDQ